MIEILTNLTHSREFTPVMNSGSGSGFEAGRSTAFEKMLEERTAGEISDSDTFSAPYESNPVAYDEEKPAVESVENAEKPAAGIEETVIIQAKNKPDAKNNKSVTFEQAENRNLNRAEGERVNSDELKKNANNTLLGIMKISNEKQRPDSLKSAQGKNSEGTASAPSLNKKQASDASAVSGVLSAADLVRALSDLIKNMKGETRKSDEEPSAPRILKNSKSTVSDPAAEVMKKLSILKKIVEEASKENGASRHEKRFLNMAVDLLRKIEAAAGENLREQSGGFTPTGNELKDLSTKLTIITEAVRGNNVEKSSDKSGEAGTDTNGRFSFGFMKDDGGISAKRIAPAAAVADTARFNENFGQVLDRARISVRDAKNAEFSLRMNPKELGAMSVNLGLEHGILNAKFIVESESAREHLLSNLDEMMNRLREEGIEVGDFDVSVDSRGRESHESRETDENNAVYSFHDKEAAAVEYDSVQAVRHTGSLNLVI
jgi:flagellar hook-length control protein FliK